MLSFRSLWEIALVFPNIAIFPHNRVKFHSKKRPTHYIEIDRSGRPAVGVIVTLYFFNKGCEKNYIRFRLFGKHTFPLHRSLAELSFLCHYTMRTVFSCL